MRRVVRKDTHQGLLRPVNAKLQHSEKRPYRAPGVRRLGKIKDQTQGAHIGGILDIGGNSAY